LDRAVPGFVSTLWALTYTITPRLVVDAGMDVALTPDAPFRKHLVLSFVYSLAELYPRIRRRLKGKRRVRGRKDGSHGWRFSNRRLSLTTSGYAWAEVRQDER
jgi:hypothetical protein